MASKAWFCLWGGGKVLGRAFSRTVVCSQKQENVFSQGSEKSRGDSIRKTLRKRGRTTSGQTIQKMASRELWGVCGNEPYHDVRSPGVGTQRRRTSRGLILRGRWGGKNCNHGSTTVNILGKKGGEDVLGKTLQIEGWIAGSCFGVEQCHRSEWGGGEAAEKEGETGRIFKC